MFRFKTKQTETPAQDIRPLRPEEVEMVTGGEGKVVIVGCTTPRPMGGYPPGTIVWNPWINPRGPVSPF